MFVYKLNINNHKTVSNDKDMNKFSTSIKSLMNLNQNFFFSLFHILMSKANYDLLENFQRMEKKMEKSLINLIAAFDHKYMN